ncbi:MAG TPA: DUF2207 domain-containing protein, partial [Ilumatobacteraceae bacterium]|nr:DUF2207 domain-containing protein [Ilumatobacteraceae bacterium]
GRDGTLAVRYQLDLDATPRTFRLRVPPGARFAAVDGKPIALDGARYADLTVDGSVTITYELSGHVQRFADAAVVTLGGPTGSNRTLDSDLSLFGCPRCSLSDAGYGEVPVTIALYTEAPSTIADTGTVWLSNTLDRRHVRTHHDASTDTGAASGPLVLQAVTRGDAVALIATFPADAVPDVARSSGASAVEIDAVIESIDDGARSFTAVGRDGGGPSVFWSVVMTVLALIAVVLVAHGLVSHIPFGGIRRRGQPDGVGGEVPRPSTAERPDDLTPVAVALVTEPARNRVQRATAAALLSMGERGAISIAGTERRLTLFVPDSAELQGPFERAVLDQLVVYGTRASQSVAGERRYVGPRLWGSAGVTATASLRSGLQMEGANLGLIRRRPLAVAMIPLAIAFAVIAIVVFDGIGVLAVLTAVAGIIGAIAISLMTPPMPTARGRAHAAVWNQYAGWHQPDDVQRASVSAIWTMGSDLTYGAALGTARKVVEALGPPPPAGRRGAKQPRGSKVAS